MSDARLESADRLVWVVGSGIAVALAIVLLIVTSAMPAVCPAIYPAPASCQPGARVPWAVATIVLLVIGWAGLALAARFVSLERLHPTLTWLSVLLGAVLVVGLGATLFASGFIFP